MTAVTNLVESLEHKGLWTKVLELDRNQFLKVQDSMDTNLYWVVQGSLRIYVVEENEEHTIRFGYTHNFIAALDSFLDEKPSDLYIQALKKTTVKVIDKATFMEFMQSSPENIKTWQLLLEQLVLQQMERERDILTMSPTERYRRVLKRSPRLFQEIPHKYIASYLRMTPETLSRIKKS
jgi:CRP-like cAMP-binding protein